MQQRFRKKGKLFYKILFFLILASLLPFGVSSLYILKLTKQTAVTSGISDLKVLAGSFSAGVLNYIKSHQSIILNFSKSGFLQKDFNEDTKKGIKDFLDSYPAVNEISIINNKGIEFFSADRSKTEPSYIDYSKDDIFKYAYEEGIYVGNLHKIRGLYPALDIAVSVINTESGLVSKIIKAKLILNDISAIIRNGLKSTPGITAAIFAPASDNFLIAHSDIAYVFKKGSRLSLDIASLFDRATTDKQMQFSKGKTLAAFVPIEKLGWYVYAGCSDEVIAASVKKIRAKTWQILVLIMLLVLIMSYAVSLFILKPVLALKNNTLKISAGDFEGSSDLKISDDEIGDLSAAFNQMRVSLKDKTNELLAAKEEVEGLNRTLENRVETRTRELKAAQGELVKNERLAAIGQMASIVSHEIRNPLAIMNNSAYLIKHIAEKKDFSDAKIAKISKHASVIESEIIQANSIIDEILNFARTKKLETSVLGINAYLKSIISVFPVSENIKVIQKFSDSEIYVDIDAEQMKQVFRNLIGNAVEVMEDGGALTLTVDAVESVGVMVEIRDTGCGIKKEAADKIFNPFYTTKARGTGLGLAVVKKIVDMHKGKIEIETEENKGTAFRIFLNTVKKREAA